MARLRTGSICSLVRSPTHSPASMSSTNPVPTLPRSTGLKLYFLWKLVSLKTSLSNWWSLFCPSLNSSSSFCRGFRTSSCILSSFRTFVLAASAKSFLVPLNSKFLKGELFSSSTGFGEEGVLDEEDDNGEEELLVLPLVLLLLLLQLDRGSSLNRISFSNGCPCTAVSSFFAKKSASRLL